MLGLVNGQPAPSMLLSMIHSIPSSSARMAAWLLSCPASLAILLIYLVTLCTAVKMVFSASGHVLSAGQGLKLDFQHQAVSFSVAAQHVAVV